MRGRNGRLPARPGLRRCRRPWVLSGEWTEIRRPEKALFRIENHFHGYRFEHLLERRLRAKRGHETARLENLEDFRRDPPADEHASRGDRPEREVPRFGAVGLDEEVEHLAAALAGTVECRVRNRRGRMRAVEIDTGRADTFVDGAEDVL